MEVIDLKFFVVGMRESAFSHGSRGGQRWVGFQSTVWLKSRVDALNLLAGVGRTRVSVV